MIMRNTLLLPLLTFIVSTKFCRAVDLTLDDGSTGTAVVEACVSKIVRSGIFSEDFDFLRNLARVETTDGTNLVLGEGGGMWRVSSTVFSSISDGTFDVSSYYTGISSNFNITWSTVLYDDLSIPLYSALAQRLYLAYLETTEWTDEPSNSSIQGFYWARNISDSEETIADYEAAVATIDTGCIQPQRDVVFLVDSHAANDESYFTATKEIISNIVRELEIDTNLGKTVVGVGYFSNHLQVVSYFNSSASEADVLSAIDEVQADSNARFTSLLTISAMTRFFATSNGARGSSTGTPQVLCVFLAGESDDNGNGLETAASNAAVNVIAVGMTSSVTQADLDIISSGGDAERSFLRSSYSSQTAFEFGIARQICSETGILETGETYSGLVQPNERNSLSLTVRETGIDSDVSTSSGVLAVYYSAANEDPTSAYHDYSLTVPNPNRNARLSYVPTVSELNGTLTVILYITLEATTDIPVQFTITIDEDSVNVTTDNPPTSSSSGLSAGEVAGIVFSCLILFCAVLVAVVYYRFGKPGRRKPLSWVNRDKLDRPMESRSGNDMETTSLGPSPSGNETEASAKRLETNVRERLNSAMRRRDLLDLNDAVEDFMALKLDDYDGDFVKAQRMIMIHQCKQGISYAIQMRNIKMLEKAIFKGKRMEYDVELKMELVNAEILLQDLKRTDNLLRRLKRAMDVHDISTVEVVTAELRVLKGCDQAMVDRMLLAFQLREDIEEAMLRRDISGIRESMARIEEKDLAKDLAAEMKQARKMLKDLTVVENARSDVMGLKQSRVSEIRSYATPPPGVHEVMMSVYLLLGYHPTQLQSWTAIQSLMGKTGREGLRRMIAELELTSVDVMHGRMARPLIENFDLHHIRELSEALAVFYVFVQSVIKEVEKLQPEGDQDNASHMDMFDGSGTPYTMTPFISR